jgi:nucleoside-diphosphate-sugar epimerase
MNGTTQLIADRSNATDLEKATQAVDRFDVVIDTSAYTARDTEIAWTDLSDKTSQWIHLSSAAVYTETPGRAPSEIDAIGGPAVWGQYGIDKSAADQFLIDHAGKIPVTIFRPPYIYGPNNSVDRETFIWNRVLQQRPIIIPADGETVMQFIHVEELAVAFKMAITKTDLNHKRTVTYNIASDQMPAQNEWVDIVAKVTGLSYKAVCAHDKAKEFAIRQYFPFRDYPCALDTALIKDQLGWKQKYSLAEGFAQTYLSYDPTVLKSKVLDTSVEDKILALLK